MNEPKKGDGTAAGASPERPVSERYTLFVRGYKDGANALVKRYEGDPSYERGYSDGEAGRASAARRFGEEIGYTPSVLR